MTWGTLTRVARQREEAVTQNRLRRKNLLMKDQLIIILEAVRVAQNTLEVEGHTQATLDGLRSLLCNEDVASALRFLSYEETDASVAPHDGLPSDWREHSRAA